MSSNRMSAALSVLMTRNFSKIFLRARRALEFSHGLDPKRTFGASRGPPARNFFSLQALPCITTPERFLMRTILLGLLAVAGIAIATPVVSPASAQVRVETPAGDVRVGPGHDRDRDRDYDRRRHRDHRCHTVTIRRDDGSVRRTRRCD